MHLETFPSQSCHTHTSHYVDHPLKHSNPQATASLVEGGDRGPVLTEGIKAFYAAQRAAVTPAPALQARVPSCQPASHPEMADKGKKDRQTFG